MIVRTVSAVQEAEGIRVGDKILTRKKSEVSIEFYEGDVGRMVAVSVLVVSFLKFGSVFEDAIRYISFLYPEDSGQFEDFTFQ